MDKSMNGWRRYALPASLVLNLFFLALVGGYFLHGRHEEADYGTPVARFLAKAEKNLSPEDAAKFREALRRDAARFGETGRELTETRQELARQIAADPFDPEATRRALEAWRQAGNRFLDEFSGSFVEALGKISPTGRRKLVPERGAGKT